MSGIEVLKLSFRPFDRRIEGEQMVRWVQGRLPDVLSRAGT